MRRRPNTVTVIRRTDDGTYFRGEKRRYGKVRRTAWTPNIEKAKHYWQGEQAERFFLEATEEEGRPPYEVVGVVLVDHTEFTVFMELSHLPGHQIPMCGLCGNTGRISHVVPVPPGPKAPVREYRLEAYCICPNGRADKAKKE